VDSLSRLDRRHTWRVCLVGLCRRRTDHAELGSSNGTGRSAEKVAEMKIIFFWHLDRIHR
jgi:hypothetical protein